MSESVVADFCVSISDSKSKGAISKDAPFESDILVEEARWVLIKKKMRFAQQADW